MKKFLSIVTVAAAAAVWYALPVFAASFDVNGEYRARGYSISNAGYAEGTDQNWLDARFRTNLTVKQGMTTGVVQVDFLNASTDSNGQDSTGNLTLGNDTGNTYGLLGVRQAYLAIGFPHVTLIGGRYEVKLGNGLVLNDTSDLVAVAAPVGPVNLLLGYLVLGDNDGAQAPASPAGPALGANNDDTAVALNVGFKAAGADLNVFGVMANLPSVVPGTTQLNVYGLTGAGAIGPVSLLGEVDMFSGDATTTASFEGTNILVAGSMPLAGLTLGAAFISASGQGASDLNINTIDGDFRASNILVRDDFNNYEGVSSLSVGAVNTGSYITGGLGLQAIKVSAAMAPFKALGSTHAPEIGLVFANTAEDDASGNNDLGTEIYVNTNCTFDKNLSANIGLAMVSAGDVLGTKDQLKAEAALSYRF